MDPLLSQPHYVMTISTGTVHSVPCVRNTSPDPVPWPDVAANPGDHACKHCLPAGLPPLRLEGTHWRLA